MLVELDAETTAHDGLDRPCFPAADERVLGVGSVEPATPQPAAQPGTIVNPQRYVDP